MRTILALTALAAAFALSACATTSTIQYDANTLQITTSAAPACGAAGAQKVAYADAAIETIKHGFDRFVVLDAAAQNNVKIVGTTPVYANTYGTAIANRVGNSVYATGQSQTYFTGGYPVVGGSHDQAFLIRMYRDGDTNASSAISARDTLGPDWAQQVARPPDNCLQ